MLQNTFEINEITKLFNQYSLDSTLHFHFYCKDKDGRYLNSNQRMVFDLGLRSQNDLLGLTDFDLSFLTRDQTFTLKKNDDFVIHKATNHFFVEPVTFSNGKKVIALSNKGPLRLRSKKIVGTTGLSLIINEENLTQLPIALQSSFEKSFNPLTKQQENCLYYLSKGLTIKQIGKKINLSPRTVEHYLEQVKKKLHCQNRAQLISAAIHMNLKSHH